MIFKINYASEGTISSEEIVSFAIYTGIPRIVSLVGEVFIQYILDVV